MRPQLLWQSLWRRLLPQQQMEEDIEAEIAFHLQGRFEELLDEGLSPEDARKRSIDGFGDRHRIMTEMAAASGTRVKREERKEWVGSMLREIRTAIRGLLKRPGFTFAVGLTLALGIGANTAVFSVLNSVILAPLPYEDPGQLVRVRQEREDNPGGSGFVTGPAFLDYRAMEGGLREVAAVENHSENGVTLTGLGRPQRVLLLPVTANYFRTYGTEPFLGRGFLGEEEYGEEKVAVMSHRLWSSLSDNEQDILGRRILLDAESFEVVGVMPEHFRDALGGEVDIWTPLDIQLASERSRGNHYLSLLGRLRAGATLEETQARFDALSAHQAREYPRPHEGKVARLVPLHDQLAGDTGTPLIILLAAANAVLLMAVTNVAGLLLARNMSRGRELAVRAALGSGRVRLFQYLLTESLVLAGLGGAAGVLLAFWGVNVLLGVAPDSLPSSLPVTPDTTLLLFALGITLLTGVLAGCVPAYFLSRVDTGQSLREGGRSTTGTGGNRRVQDAFVTVQVAGALALLIGAGLLMKSFLNLQGTELGIEATNVASFRVHLPDARFTDPEERIALHQTLQDRLEALPGVRATGAISWLPVSGEYNSWGFRHRTDEGELVWESANFRVVEGDYFEAMGVDLVQGRVFDRADDRFAEPVALINRAFVEAYYAGRDPLTQVISAEGRQWQVVGVVENVAHAHRGQMVPKVYLPHGQFGDNRNWELAHVVATDFHQRELVSRAREALRAVDPDLVLHNDQSLETVMAQAIARETFISLLMGFFALVAVALAATGLYGVLSHAVVQRNREIGIRAALGANAWQIRRTVAHRHAILVASGLALGTVCALATSRVLATLLYDVSERDPRVFLASLLVVAAMATLSGQVPLRRATKIDPVEVMREE